MKKSHRSLSLPYLLGVATLTLLPLSPVAMAESVAVPVASQAPELKNIDRPRRGETKDSVEKRFGQPKESSKPVGDPPISKWTYDNFTVFFENDYVIHSVLTPHK